MALGAICQNYARQQAEELEFVMTCMRRAMDNEQADYEALERAMDAFREDASSKAAERVLSTVLKAVLVMHVFYEPSVDSAYTKAINAWLLTLSA